jgi:hypothetical protein
MRGWNDRPEVENLLGTLDPRRVAAQRGNQGYGRSI